MINLTGGGVIANFTHPKRFEIKKALRNSELRAFHMEKDKTDIS